MTASYGVENITPGRVATMYASGRDIVTPDGVTHTVPWLYVIARTGDVVSGVLFDNDASNAHPVMFGTTVQDIEDRRGSTGVTTHPLSAVGWWADTIAGYLSTPDTFPDVKIPSSETVPVVAGDMIPRADIVARLTRASEVASEYADANSLCGEFERCMEAIGMEDLGLMSVRTRERLYDVSFTGEVETTCDHCGSETTDSDTVTHSIYVTARNDDDAREVLLSEHLDWLEGHGWDHDTSDLVMERA